jgi:sigma-B regulation protein RsbU (phosphoserine phosphatase)
MSVPDELAWLDALSRVLERAHLWRPEEIAETVDATMARLGITSTIYVVDAEQRALRALPRPGVETPAPTG